MKLHIDNAHLLKVHRNTLRTAIEHNPQGESRKQDPKC